MNKKKEFDQTIGGFVNSAYLSNDEREVLVKILPKRMTKQQQDRFLMSVSETVDVWKKTAGFIIEKEEGEEAAKQIKKDELWEEKTTKQVKKEIQDVGTSARQLQASLNAFRGESSKIMAAHFNYLIRSKKSSITFPGVLRAKEPKLGELLESQMVILDALIKTADYVQSKIETGNDSLRNQKIRSLITNVARSYKSIVGKLPPKSNNTWFVEFMKKLGEIVKIKGGLGSDVVKTAITELDSI